MQAAYHKAFKIFCRKIKEGKFRTQTATPETYLFEIGKFCLMKIKYPKKKKDKPTFVITETIADSTNPSEEKIEQDHSKKLVERLLQKLTPHCAKLIRARKIEEQSIEQITKENNYRNANATKSAISKCFKCLKNIAKESRKKG